MSVCFQIVLGQPFVLDAFDARPSAIGVGKMCALASMLLSVSTLSMVSRCSYLGGAKTPIGIA